MPAVMSWLVFGLACVLVATGGALGGADPVDAAVALGFTPLGAHLVARRRGGAVGPCCLEAVAVAVEPLHRWLRRASGRICTAAGPTPRPYTPGWAPAWPRPRSPGRSAGAALAAAHRAAALQRSRTLLVTAREKERRRISRDLHDGLGAFLAGIGFAVDAAGNAVKIDPERARGLLTQIRTQVGEAEAGVRRLVRGLRPPELAQLGLAGAVEHTAATLGDGGVEIEIRAADASGLPAAVEVTAYLVAREALMTTVEGIEVVAVAEDGLRALAAVREHSPDVVLMDIAMPNMDGIEATRRLSAGPRPPSVVMLTMSDDDLSLLAAVRAGARGYLLKNAAQEDVVAAVRAAARGQAVFGTGAAESVIKLLHAPPGVSPRPFPALTGREYEILGLVASGLGNQAREAFPGSREHRLLRPGSSRHESGRATTAPS